MWFTYYLQLNELQLSFFGYVVVVAEVGVTVDEVAEGERKSLRGTETQPPFSPSLALANSNINLPSKI